MTWRSFTFYKTCAAAVCCKDGAARDAFLDVFNLPCHHKTTVDFFRTPAPKETL